MQSLPHLWQVFNVPATLYYLPHRCGCSLSTCHRHSCSRKQLHLNILRRVACFKCYCIHTHTQRDSN